jgi:hypothetical protein
VERTIIIKMKAITLHQPWASLVAVGAKRIETRAWSTSYRGPLAIHAGKAPASGNFRAWRRMREPFAGPLRAAGYVNSRGHVDLALLPRGCIVATCTLVDVCVTCAVPRSDDVGYAQPIIENGVPTAQITPVQEPERSYGDHTPGRWAWLLADVRPVVPPVPARGRQGLWDWERDSL